MTKIKLAIDILLTAAWIVVVALGTVLRDWALVGISSAAALVFANLVWYDLIKIDNESPKYIIELKSGFYYDGLGGGTCKTKAKVYRSKKAAKKAIDELIALPSTAQLFVGVPKIEEVRIYKDV